MLQSSLFQTWKLLFIVTEILSYLGPKIWDLVPLELKKLSSLGAFKKAIKKWKPQSCPWKILVLSDIFSDILDFFNIYVLVPKNLFHFVYIRIFYLIVFVYSWPKLACIMSPYRPCIATCTLCHLICYSIVST